MQPVEDSESVEASLAEWGVEFGEPTHPDQLLVWKPEQLDKARAYLASDGWWEGFIYFGGNALQSTRPGSRAAVYETGEGIAGFFDFSGHAMRVKDRRGRFMAAGLYRPLAAPVKRSQLLRDSGLVVRFGSMVSRGSLKPHEAQRLVALGERGGRVLPRFARFAPPDWADKPGGAIDLDWVMSDRDWGCEHPIQMAIYLAPQPWRQLGCRSRPELERWSANLLYRSDLISVADRVVIEVKYEAASRDLHQLRRYLDNTSQEFGRVWQGYLVFGSGGGALISEVEQDSRYGIAAWRLSLGERGSAAPARLELVAQSKLMS